MSHHHQHHHHHNNEERDRHRVVRKLAHGSFEWRNIDGRNNNPHRPEWGEAGRPLARRTPAQYADGLNEPSGASRPSAREISNVIFAQTHDRPSPEGLSAWFWLWGQVRRGPARPP